MTNFDFNRVLLSEIEEYCRRAGVAESTFGKLAVNDGKFVGRLRDDKNITIKTISRVRDYISENAKRKGFRLSSASRSGGMAALWPESKPESELTGDPSDTGGDIAQGVKSAFRFYDNRQKYLMFVNTCSEKWVVAARAGMELAHIHPQPPALRVFDAGMGDGTVLTSLMRQMHQRFRHIPLYVVGKEISLEDVRLSLEKMPDRFHEHPATVLIVTNLYYTEAPTLAPNSMQAAATLNWVDVPLVGDSAHGFHEQISNLGPILSEGWQARSSPKTGNPLYVRPSVLVLYREDQKFLLDSVIPKPGASYGDYDLVIASQPYRARTPLRFKVEQILAPLVKSLAPGGRLLGVHSFGQDPGLEIIQRIWPRERPFIHNRHELLKGLKDTLRKSHRDINYNTYSDKRALFRYEMHTLPSEVGAGADNIGISTLLAAWNAATYVAQIEDQRLEDILADRSYLVATREILNRHKGLWFWDESFVVSRQRR